MAQHPDRSLSVLMNRRLRPVPRRQRGFGMLTIVIGTALLLAATVAVVATARGPARTDASVAPIAQEVIGQANALLTAYRAAVSKGGFMVSKLAFTTDSLYSPSLTGLSELPPLSRAMSTATQNTFRPNWRWQLARRFRLPGFGPLSAATTADGAEVAFYLFGIDKAVCREVNRITTGSPSMAIDGDKTRADPPAMSGTTVQTILGQSGVSDTSLQTSANIAPDFYGGTVNPTISAEAKVFPRIGCYQLSSATDMYFVYAVAEAN